MYSGHPLPLVTAASPLVLKISLVDDQERRERTTNFTGCLAIALIITSAVSVACSLYFFDLVLDSSVSVVRPGPFSALSFGPHSLLVVHQIHRQRATVASLCSVRLCHLRVLFSWTKPTRTFAQLHLLERHRQHSRHLQPLLCHYDFLTRRPHRALLDWLDIWRPFWIPFAVDDPVGNCCTPQPRALQL